MSKPAIKRSLIAIGLLALVGVLGAQTYYIHELSRALALSEPQAPQGPSAWPAAGPSDPWPLMQGEVARMQADMDRMLGHPFPGSWAGALGGPTDGEQVSLQDQGDSYVVKARIPGAKKGDINVDLDGRLLSISSQTQGAESRSADKGGLTRQERYASSFQQAFTLPGPVDSVGMHSQFNDGVLTVTIPKAAS